MKAAKPAMVMFNNFTNEYNSDTQLTCRQHNGVIMIKRGQMHNGEIIRTRPQCMNPSTSTQLCQTAWSIIFSNSCGLESDYRAPSVTQTPAPEQVTPWLFTNMSLTKIHPVSWNIVLELCPGCPCCVKFVFSSSDDFTINHLFCKVCSTKQPWRGYLMSGETAHSVLFIQWLNKS